jgi:hypothetical protein
MEERMTALEQELAQLKQQVQNGKQQDATPWWQQISGVFKDCPEFDEAMRLGRKWRESQRMPYDREDRKRADNQRGSA